MPKNKSEGNIITRFFGTDSTDGEDMLNIDPTKESTDTRSSQKTFTLPQIQKVEPASEKVTRNFWKKLRSFFRSGEGGGLPFFKDTPLLRPVHFAGTKNNHETTGYPLWLNDPREAAHFDTDIPLGAPLRLLLQSIFDDEQSTIDNDTLRFHLDRIRKYIWAGMSDSTGYTGWEDCLNHAIEKHKQDLASNNSANETYQDELAYIKANLPTTGVLLPYSRFSPIVLLSYASMIFRFPLLKQLTEDVQSLKPKLSELLTVEDDKALDADPGKLRDMLEFADAHIRFDALSQISRQQGSEDMPGEEYLRIQKTISLLTNAESILKETEAHLIISDTLQVNDPPDWEALFPRSHKEYVADENLVENAMKAFDQMMVEVTPIFAALRIAKLEISDQYLPEVHDEFFEKFDWRNLTDEELALCPPIFIISDDHSFAGKAMPDFSWMLSTYRPIKIVSLKFKENWSDRQHEFTFQQEPGIFAVSHRHTHVVQATAVPALDTYQAFIEGFTSELPGLFRILIPPEELTKKQDQYEWLISAIKGRFFPQFTYNSRRSNRWGKRFDISSNPQIESPWPAFKLEIENGEKVKEELNIPFTFADFATLRPDLHREYFIVPAEYWTENLVPLSSYLTLSQEEIYGKVPFVWMVDESNVVVKVAVSWRLVLMSQERQDFWDFLQENAGTRNIYVEQAVHDTKEQLNQSLREEIQKLKEDHKIEIQRAQEAAVAQGIERLVKVLVDDGDMDALSDLVSPGIKAPDARDRQDNSEKSSKSQDEKEAVNDEITIETFSTEAWIESEMCTSCNDCIDINRNIFKYNAEKLAYIADPKGGPYKDIVKAAEKCPAAIIHPGLPQDPKEKNLDALIKRAAKFN